MIWKTIVANGIWLSLIWLVCDYGPAGRIGTGDNLYESENVAGIVWIDSDIGHNKIDGALIFEIFFSKVTG